MQGRGGQRTQAWDCWPTVGLSRTERWRFEGEIVAVRAGHICSSCVYPLCGRAPVDTPAQARLRSLPQTLVERDDSLPEHQRWAALTRLPINDGFPHRAHQRGQLPLATRVRDAARESAHRSRPGTVNLTSPGQNEAS